jgi:hypothetical protein
MWRRKVERSTANAAVAIGSALRRLARLAAVEVGSGVVGVSWIGKTGRRTVTNE